MSSFAPVVPIQIARYLQKAPGDLLGEYHLLLAHDVVEDIFGYQEVYGQVRERYGAKSFIIMDNSVVELGEAVSTEMLLEACQIVRPDCLVIPDVMNDGKGTRDRTTDFMWRWGTLKNSSPEWMPPLMGVIQGEDVGDCIQTYYYYRDYTDIEYIAIPRIIAQRQGSRMPVLQALAGMSKLHTYGDVRRRQIHLLGFSDDLLDDVSCARMPCVMGIDSAVPIRAALLKRSLVPFLSVGPADICGPRGAFWTEPVPEDLYIRTVLERNIVDIRRWISPRRSR